ncbi:short chain dehydrogenase [Dothidotthia symphoricarpi CBS 119687]|uniref:Short chain dehydrogenase n=1 Tax=Dothidotthia symphoricarpi CBS 119687 TaxID=1392245 RepID=A0A6A6AR47_9PLEO|nr:short chain dehydrogenase [Dothidotthia symphoricarpi CBS 119687]KAF2132981.1 short chain dehydrogenase [Dothidotthia symphoricarpi CBS 119687]
MGIANFVYTQYRCLPKPTGSYIGRTVIVTGSNIGLGKEAARHFAQLGASIVILAVRSLEKGEAAREEITASTGVSKDVMKVWKLDMASYQSVLDFAARAENELERIDIALLNAGVFRSSWETFEQDESTITVNVISTFLLALALLPKLKETAEKFFVRPNITMTTSAVHEFASFPERKAPDGQIFQQLNNKAEKPDMAERYYVSKLLEVLAIRAIAQRRSADQIPVTINCVCPGYCHSELARDLGMGQTIAKAVIARSAEVGSRNLVWAASAGPECHGQYVRDCGVGTPSKYVRSTEGQKDQQRVWDELVVKLEQIKPGVTKNL